MSTLMLYAVADTFSQSKLLQPDIMESYRIQKKIASSYSIYGTLLVFPSGILDWNCDRKPVFSDDPESIQLLCSNICKRMKVTLIAINHAIPLHKPGQIHEDNILRSPSNFQPVYGDFGPSTSCDPPTESDLESAVWVTAKQYGIYQTWAPRWTMFSRGNVKEKARVQSLPSVRSAVEQGREDGKGCAAVDLYAGIGYFAFSYLSADVRKVLCWDLSRWSCEGLKRGAKSNKWSVCSVPTNVVSNEGIVLDDTRLIVFNESNEKAADRIAMLRPNLPPIRHVNCGLLPTSAGSWSTAVSVLEPNMGGWLHIHENFALQDIKDGAEGVRVEIENILRSNQRSDSVMLEHVERVKTYAPWVWHCVLDIHISPT